MSCATGLLHRKVQSKFSHRRTDGGGNCRLQRYSESLDHHCVVVTVTAGHVNPMFSLKTGLPGAYTTTDDLNETAKMDEETRKATLMTLITSRAVPSAMQWAVVQVR